MLTFQNVLMASASQATEVNFVKVAYLLVCVCVTVIKSHFTQQIRGLDDFILIICAMNLRAKQTF